MLLTLLCAGACWNCTCSRSKRRCPSACCAAAASSCTIPEGCSKGGAQGGEGGAQGGAQGAAAAHGAPQPAADAHSLLRHQAQAQGRGQGVGRCRVAARGGRGDASSACMAWTMATFTTHQCCFNNLRGNDVFILAEAGASVNLRGNCVCADGCSVPINKRGAPMGYVVQRTPAQLRFVTGWTKVAC